MKFAGGLPSPSVGRFRTLNVEGFCKLASGGAKKLGRSRDILDFGCLGITHDVNFIKQITNFPISAGPANHRDDPLAKLSRQLSNSERRFSRQSLSIQTTFARDDQIGFSHCRFETRQLSNQLEARPNLRGAESH